jgi:hypothetical protein
MRRQAEMTSSAAKMNAEMISWDYFTFAERERERRDYRGIHRD